MAVKVEILEICEECGIAQEDAIMYCEKCYDSVVGEKEDLEDTVEKLEEKIEELEKEIKTLKEV